METCYYCTGIQIYDFDKIFENLTKTGVFCRDSGLEFKEFRLDEKLIITYARESKGESNIFVNDVFKMADIKM